MIVYDLKCAKGHVFESWFPDSAAFQVQSGAGTVVCPLCGDNHIERELSAPRISTGRNRGGQTLEEAREASAEAMRALTNVRRFIEQNCDDVGERFPEEARKIHYGEIEKRNICGEASQNEADELRDEGVEFGELPFPFRRDA